MARPFAYSSKPKAEKHHNRPNAYLMNTTQTAKQNLNQKNPNTSKHYPTRLTKTRLPNQNIQKFRRKKTKQPKDPRDIL